MPGFGHWQAFWRSDVTAPIISDFLVRHVPVGATAQHPPIPLSTSERSEPPR
jgi:hypothetical protein